MSVEGSRVSFVASGQQQDRTFSLETARAQAQRDAVVAHSSDLVLYFEIDGTIAWASPATQGLFGTTPTSIIGRKGMDLIHPDDRERAFLELTTITGLGDSVRTEFRVIAEDGSVHWIEETATNLIDDPQVGYVVANLNNITARKRDEEEIQLRKSLAELSAIVRHSTDAIFSTDLAGIVQTWNQAAERLYGYSAADMIGRDIAITVPPKHAIEMAERVLSVHAGGSIASLDTTRRRADGTDVHMSISISPILDATGRVVGVSAVARDITARKQLEFDLWHQAKHDALTGLANRTYLIEQLELLLAPTEVTTLVGVLLFDVDRFKLVNDSLGHDRGDQLLVAIAEKLRDTLGPDDVAARFGSDAFAIITPGLGSPDEALDLAQRIRTGLADGLRVGADRHLPTISVGIVIATEGDSSITALRDAETAMYRAKERGHDRAEWFDPALHRDVVAGFEVERDLRRAIYHDELYLEFQPVTDLETGEICSCEALVRWHHPTRGVLNPDDFIPVAEHTSLIVSVGRWVLQSALTTAATWPEGVQIAVNLSPRELAEPDLVAFVKYALAAVGMNVRRGSCSRSRRPQSWRIRPAAARAISALRALGVSIVVDDFGTGYTSLSFLRDHQLDGLKIDRSYVTDLEHGSTAIVDAMIRMSAALGLHRGADDLVRQRLVGDLDHSQQPLGVAEQVVVDHQPLEGLPHQAADDPRVRGDEVAPGERCGRDGDALLVARLGVHGLGVGHAGCHR